MWSALGEVDRENHSDSWFFLPYYKYKLDLEKDVLVSESGERSSH